MLIQGVLCILLQLQHEYKESKQFVMNVKNLKDVRNRNRSKIVIKRIHYEKLLLETLTYS